MKKPVISEVRWKVKEQAELAVAQDLAHQLSTRVSFPLPLANILVQRGIDTFEKARSYFAPQLAELHDPFLMKDLGKAAERIQKAFEKNEKLLIYGDYDVDGTTSVALWTLFAQAWGLQHAYYLPDRYTEGYGLSYRGVDFAHNMGAQVLLTLDCGIKAHEVIRYANQKGIDVIVCDHHTPGTDLPEALAVIDPKRSDCPYPFKELTGCGIGYKLALGVHELLTQAGHAPLDQEFDPRIEFLDLLALSIACDIVPLVGENRTLSFHGLKKLKENPLKGIGAIKNLSDREREWDVSDLVFFIGPHINSAGRLTHAREAVEVLLGTEKGLAQLQQTLGASNEARKDIDREITEQALQLIAGDAEYGMKHSTVLYQESWHKGVIGIVASRLIERYYRPTVIFTHSEGKLVGSARSVKGFNLYEALQDCIPHLLQFGGHKYAAGLSLKKESFPDFCEAFEEAVARRIKPEQKYPLLEIDQELSFDHIDDRFVRLLNRLRPFGPHNMTPVFMSREVEVMEASILKGQHLRILLRQNGRVFSAIGFNLAEKWTELNSLSLDVAYQPSFNVWKDKKTINLKLKDIRLPHAH
jgi:single-stranded-DNA-specific exonuclease